MLQGSNESKVEPRTPVIPGGDVDVQNDRGKVKNRVTKGLKDNDMLEFRGCVGLGADQAGG
jgi:hypothetical protein